MKRTSLPYCLHGDSLQSEILDPGNVFIDDYRCETLTKDVAERLGERAFCVVFEDDLERCWPSNEIAQATRQREIQEFAESQGWTATILDAEFGTRVIFSKA